MRDRRAKINDASEVLELIQAIAAERRCENVGDLYQMSGGLRKCADQIKSRRHVLSLFRATKGTRFWDREPVLGRFEGLVENASSNLSNLR